MAYLQFQTQVWLLAAVLFDVLPAYKIVCAFVRLSCGHGCTDYDAVRRQTLM